MPGVTTRRNPEHTRPRPVVALVVLALSATLLTLGFSAPSPATGPTIPWSQLHNPLLAYPDRALKDPALIWSDHRWVVLFSQIGP